MLPLAPGNVAACWATSAEFSRGLRVEVPGKRSKRHEYEVKVMANWVPVFAFCVIFNGTDNIKVVAGSCSRIQVL